MSTTTDAQSGKLQTQQQLGLGALPSSKSSSIASTPPPGTDSGLKKRRLPSAPLLTTNSSTGSVVSYTPNQQQKQARVSSASGNLGLPTHSEISTQQAFDRGAQLILNDNASELVSTAAYYPTQFTKPLAKSTGFDGPTPRSPSIRSGPLHPDLSSPPKNTEGTAAPQQQVSTGVANAMGSPTLRLMEVRSNSPKMEQVTRTPPRASTALPPVQTTHQQQLQQQQSPSLPPQNLGQSPLRDSTAALIPSGFTDLPILSSLGPQEGPYPSDARPRKSMDWDEVSGGVVIGSRRRSGLPARNGMAGSSPSGKPRPGGDAPPLRIKVPPPQEEICLECLMRDRDLIHVDVTSEDAWERSSDVDWRQKLETEDAVVKSFRTNPEVLSRRRSVLQHGSAEERIKLESRLLREEDELVGARVGWRGLSWEEDDHGSGLPRHFRGRVEGELLEQRLRELATRVSSFFDD